MHIVKTKKISWLMIVVLFITFSSIPPDLAFAAKVIKPSKKELEQAAQKLERLFDALGEAAKEIPRDTFDPKAIVEKFGTDPEKLFEWVRDNTYLVPYRGTLRGPIGVMMDRLGNSLDRALLLRELLTIAGHKARLARATFSHKMAEELLRESVPIPPHGALPAEDTSEESLLESIEEYTRNYRLDPSKLQNTFNRLTLERQLMTEEISQRVEEQTKDILELVGKTPDIRPAEWSKAVMALQDHWWIQWKSDSGWANLDPNLPEAKIGSALAESEATYQPGTLNKDLLHLVTIRIVIERREENSNLEKETVLEHTIQPSKLFSKRIILRHVPLNWPKDLDFFAEGRPLERLKTVVLEEKEWLPVLSVGSEQIVQFSFTDTGLVKKIRGIESAPDSKRSTLPQLSLFGNAKQKRKRGSILTSEWIECEVHSPGQNTHIIRRQLFNLFENQHRMQPRTQVKVNDKLLLKQNLNLLSISELFILCCHLSEDYVRHFFYRSILSNKKTISSAMLLAIKGNAIDFLKQDKEIDLASRELLEFSSGRMMDQVYIDTPNVFAYHSGLRAVDSGNTVFAFRALNLIYNKVAPLPHHRGNTFRNAVRSGVWDAFWESALVKSSERNGFLSSMDQQMIGWRKILDQEIEILRCMNWSPTSIEFIRSELAKGFVVLVPKRVIRHMNTPVVKWWRVDPRSGNTMIMGNQGWGEALTSYVRRLDQALSIIAYLTYFAGLYICVHKATNTELMTPITEPAVDSDSVFYKCIMEVVCKQLMSMLSPLSNIKPKTAFELGGKQLYGELFAGLCKIP